MADVAENLAS